MKGWRKTRRDYFRIANRIERIKDRLVWDERPKGRKRKMRKVRMLEERLREIYGDTQ